jgi:hypothetical protein
MLEERRQAEAVGSWPAHGTSAKSAAAEWLSANWFRLSIALAMVVVALSIGHYTMVTLPAIKRDQLAAQEQAEKRRGLESVTASYGLQMCLDAADLDYHAGWEKECESRGLGTDCSLPGPTADRQDGRRKEARDDCFRRYPAR